MDISLLSTIDTNYRTPFQVLVHSVAADRRKAAVIQWHVVTDEPEEGWTDWIAAMNARWACRAVTFILHGAAWLQAEHLPLRGRARPIMYARILAPAKIPCATARLLYLDADMIALQPLEPLWEIDLGQHACACSQDIAIPQTSSGMAISQANRSRPGATAPYFNAGVMLIDRRQWLEAGVPEKALEYLAASAGRINLFDQEALNVAVGGNWLRISYRWNLIASVAGRPFLDTRALDNRDYRDSLAEPRLVHFAGTLKPWQNPFLAGRWYELYRRAMSDALPGHAVSLSWRHWLQAIYDRHLRWLAYPLERRVWIAMGGF